MITAGSNGGSENMEEFNRLAATVLSILHDAFPHLLVLNANDLYENPNELSLSYIDGTMQFLQSEGFIVFTDSAGDGQIYLGVQLTMKGLGVLNKVPEALGSKETILQKMKVAVKSGSKVLFTEAVKSLISESVKGSLS